MDPGCEKDVRNKITCVVAAEIPLVWVISECRGGIFVWQS